MRILLVDDHDIIRRGVRSLLETYPDLKVCGEAVDGQDAVQKALELKPDVIIMDVSMPRLNGLEATREVRRLVPTVEVVILSQHDSPQVLHEALNAGARAYVMKSSIGSQLVAALENVRKPQAFVDTATNGDGEMLNVQKILERSAAFEKALIESEERFRSTFELAPVGIAHIAPDGHWLRLNRKACEILGHTQEELVTLTFRDVMHPDDLAKDVELKEELLAGLLPEYSLEKRFIQKSGSIVWVNSTVSSVRDSEGKVKYLIAVGEDITERREAEVRLREAEYELRATAAHLNLVTDTMAVAVARCTRDLQYAWVSPRYAEWLKRPVDQIVGRFIAEVVGAEAFEQLRPKFEQVLGGVEVAYEEKINYAGIGPRWISAVYTPTFDVRGVVNGWIGVVLDITEKKQAEEAHQESEARLRSSEAKLQQFAASLEKHVAERTKELANKNAELEKQSELVHRLTARLLQAGDQERRRIAQNLHDSAGQILAAVGLNLASITTRAKEISPEIVGAAEESRLLVQQLTEEIRTLSYLLHPPLLEATGLIGAISWFAEGVTKRSQISVKLELAPEVGRLPHDLELAIFRIVQECLTNVYRHSGSKSATIRLQRDSKGVALQVEDEGRGMSAQELHRIQTSDSGVGIRGMQERIRLFSGSLDIRSGREGTKIAVKFPLQKAMAQAN
jgi:PAS domain S-box-containing protein